MISGHAAPRALLRRLDVLAEAVDSSGLRAVLVGNAAAVLHGVPVTTHDADFLVADGPGARRALHDVAEHLRCTVTRPFFHAGLRWRLAGGPHAVRADFLTALDGFRHPRGVLARAVLRAAGVRVLRVAALEDIWVTKVAAGRPRDLETLPLIEAVLAQRLTVQPR
ncbi:MAG: nucleotidyltransferase [Deltaproteobacteria bacterium]|nr:nucleotidyltransferase [Deltaproteobacteria bacterium]